MKTALRIIAIVLLVFLGFGGIYGAWMLISDPSGGKFNWSLDLLNGTPFKTYLIPGIVLMVSNGLFPLFIAVITIMKKKIAGWLIMIQGFVTIGWLTVQLVLNPEFFVPVMHYTTYTVGILLAITGLLLLNLTRLDH